MNIEEFKSSIAAYVDMAINTVNTISEGDNILEIQKDSIIIIDNTIEYLHSLWAKELIDDTTAWNASVSFGVLLGEIIIKEQGFHWTIDQEMPVVETNAGNQLSPISKIYKIITAEDNLEGTPSDFYNTFLLLQNL